MLVQAKGAARDPPFFESLAFGVIRCSQRVCQIRRSLLSLPLVARMTPDSAPIHILASISILVKVNRLLVCVSASHGGLLSPHQSRRC